MAVDSGFAGWLEMAIFESLNDFSDRSCLPAKQFLDAQLQSLEKHYIEEALKVAKGNESKAAKLLNINHHTFRYRKKKLLGE